MFSKFILFAMVWLQLAQVQAAATKYNLDKSHGKVAFEVTHLMISTVEGNFQKFDGSFDYDAASGKVSNLSAVIDMNSVKTDDEKRDDHLKKEDFFDVAKHPNMEFKASDFTVKEGKPTTVKGKLTLRGITKDVELKVVYKGAAKDLYGNERVGFEATGSVKREDFNVSWNKKLDKGGVVVGSDVKIVIRGEAIAEKAGESSGKGTDKAKASKS